MGYLPDMPRANFAPHTVNDMGAAPKFPTGGLRLVMTGALDFINKAPIRDAHEETVHDGDTEPDRFSSAMAPLNKPLIPVKIGALINLGRTYRGERCADLNPEGRAATRRRRQMEKRA